MKHWLEVVRTRDPDEAVVWRLVECDTGLPCRQWLPTDVPQRPLDCGGWVTADHADAVAFALGVLRWRASEGFLGGFTVADIDKARDRLDGGYTKRPPIRRAKIPIVVAA